MDNTRVTITSKPLHTLNADLVVYLAIRQPDEDAAPACDPTVKPRVETAFSLGDFTGKVEDALLYYPEPAPSPEDEGEGEGGPDGFKRILVLGMGDDDYLTDPPAFLDRLRKLGGIMAKTCEKTNTVRLAVQLPVVSDMAPGVVAETLTEGILLGDYRFDKYKQTTRKKEDYQGLRAVKLFTEISPSAVRAGAKRGTIAAKAACMARDMANEPGNEWTPQSFATVAQSLADEGSLTCTCLEKEQMAELGMGGIMAVNQGSVTPPCMVILEYRPKKVTNTLLLVGKGITFDTGGISLKPAKDMEKMKYDMCGGAAVLSAMSAVAQEKPSLRVVAIVPATDNMPGGAATHPGDIIRHVNGVTAEVVNTDAEGRLILADALAYGVNTFKPDCVVDIATLTGAAVVGLGHHYTGMISNSDDLSLRVADAGEQAGEPIWRLPLNKDYEKQIESKVADIKNVGGPAGGTITAGAYLAKFVGDTPWVHLDIAGTAWDFTEKSYIPKGPSGVGARTFIQLIRAWRKWPPTR